MPAGWTSSQTAVMRKMPPTPMLVGVGIAAVVVVSVAWSMFNWSQLIGVVVVVALAALLIGLRDPYWLAVALVAQFALIPCERSFMGHYMPNILQVGMPVALVIALLSALKARRIPRPIAPDFLIVGLGLWGALGIFVNTGLAIHKYYGTNFLYPMGFYYIVRVLRVDHARVVRSIKIILVFVATQSALMIRQSMVGASPLYDTPGRFEGTYAATGPFNMPYNAAIFLILWPALFLYVAATADTRLGRGLSYVGLLLTAYALTRTMERGQLVVIVAVIALCLLVPRLRPTATRALLFAALAYVPWSMSDAGGRLMERFDQTDQSRYAMRKLAFMIVRSPHWHPLFGVGFNQAKVVMSRVGSDEVVLLYGRKRVALWEIAQQGHALHNIYLSLLVEFGGVGALVGLGIAACLLRALARLHSAGRRQGNADVALIMALVGMFAAMAGIGYLQNVYITSAAMSTVWFFYGLLVGHAEAFSPDPTSIRHDRAHDRTESGL